MRPSDAQIEAAAADLVEAERARAPIGLLSLRHPGMGIDDAYRIQSAVIRRRLGQGRRVIGWKVGLTSRAMRDALKIDTPDSGALLDDMLFDNGATVPRNRFIQPRIEAEIAFVMRGALSGSGVTREDVIDATEAVAPAIEILDTRILRADPETGRRRAVTDTISDNAANAGVVLGVERHRPEEVDLPWVGAIVRRGDEVEETGLGAGVLGDPAESVAWLARRLHGLGDRIEPGQIVLSGSFVRPVECPPGTRIEADFGSFGHVSVGFA